MSKFQKRKERLKLSPIILNKNKRLSDILYKKDIERRLDKEVDKEAENIIKKSYLHSIKDNIVHIQNSILKSVNNIWSYIVSTFSPEELVKAQEDIADKEELVQLELETKKRFETPIKDKLRRKIKSKIIKHEPIVQSLIVEEVNNEIENEKTELDLGCNVIDDEDEDDENQDNEICKISFKKGSKSLFTEDEFSNAKNGTFPYNIEDELEKKVKRVSKSRTSSRQTPTIEKMLFDTINRLYVSGKFKAERTNDNTIVINKSSNLIEEINNSLSNYIYTDNSPIILSDSDILILLLYGVKNVFGNIIHKFRLELPKPKLRTRHVGEGQGNTEKFYKAVDCKDKAGCSLFSELTILYNYFKNESDINKKQEVIRSIILWFDTHHDFKKTRYEKAIDVWDKKFSKDGSFISWYVNKFFTLKPNDKYDFTSEAKNTILKPVVEYSKNRLEIPTQLYKISVNYLQNKNFEKSMLLHYMVHNFDFKNNNSQALLKDILYVHKDTYNNLINNIQNDINGVLQNPAINPIEKNKIIDKANIKLNKLTTFFNGFTFSTEPFNFNYVKDAGTSSFPLGDNVKYVPGALFDANKSNTYEPDDIKNTQYDNVYTKEKDVRLNTTYTYKSGGCKLEISGGNSILSKADIRCSVKNSLDFPDETRNKSLLIKYLKTKNITIETDSIFIDKMYEMLMKFVGEGGKFAIDGTSLKNPYFFNSIKVGPSVQELVFLLIFYRLGSNNTDLSLKVIDDIVNLKRLGDYGQVMDAKLKNLPFFTIDSMESLMCLIEDVSCYIDFNQGIIIYDKSNDSDPGSIRSKSNRGYKRV